ncbi:ParB/RepB/Spo0J family partition protein [Salmonella enterica subsp. enterica serovar Kotte]|nr:ParB/RepB/Spo0J family partition protein [Salmonella enterica subsp. enterica serovar Kotte]
MSVTDVKAKSPKKASPEKLSTTEKKALSAALDAAQVEFIPLSELTKSPSNMRTVPYSAESVRSLADSIASLGLLHNLIVHSMPDGQSGVAAGGRRLAALKLLASTGELNADYQAMAKRVPDDLARIASIAENEQRLNTHPAEQIEGFRSLAEEGKTPSQIGAQLGYPTRHVQRMLKLAGLAPVLLEVLAKDEITVEQCQVLTLESDHSRQIQVWEDVKTSWQNPPVHVLRSRIVNSEISMRDSVRFAFVGRETYEAAGGFVREDLFSAEDGAGTVDGLLVDRLLMTKLAAVAADIQQKEGWAWSKARERAVLSRGADSLEFQLLDIPAPVYTSAEQQRLDELTDQYEAMGSECEESDAIEAEMLCIQTDAEIREWSDEVKADCGVVVSFSCSGIQIQRGVRLVVPETDDNNSLVDTVPAVPCSDVITITKPDAAEGISLPLLTKMSSERTLAVQAALLQQPQKAVALLVWRLCTSVFLGCSTYNHPFNISLTVSHSSLTSDAPTGKSGTAYIAMMQEKERLEMILPENWKQDFTTFFSLDGETLMALMAFCTACSVDGVQTRGMGGTSRSKLDALETSIGFHMRDWWQPTKANFLTGLKHAQIVAALKDAGCTGAASDAGKMKKGDAAEFAEFRLRDTRWVPAWMKAPEPDVAPEVMNETTAHAA